MPPEPSPAGRRIAALVLPDLLCELASEQVPPSDRHGKLPLGVVLRASEGAPRDTAQGTSKQSKSKQASTQQGSAPSTLVAVNEAARRLGVRPGQSPIEALATTSRLCIREVFDRDVQSALERICEVVLAFGQPVAWEGPDTVWIDVSGSARLWREESLLAEALVEQVRSLGHGVRLAVASGPLLAQAFARWGEVTAGGTLLVPPERSAEWLASLPLLSLPLPAETVQWFARLGVLHVGQLLALPPKASSARLGQSARRLLELCRGRDDSPLVAYEPPPQLVEEVHWDEPVEGLEPLSFALRGLVGRLSARLEGRGQAAGTLLLELLLERGLRQAGPSQRPLEFELAAPLWREAELERVLRPRLEKLQLAAPLRGVRLTVPRLTHAATRQLQLGRGPRAGQAARWGPLEGAQPEELSVLLAELAADVGPEQVGRLRRLDRHRPEASSVLEPLRDLSPGRGGEGRGGNSRGGDGSGGEEPGRPEPGRAVPCGLDGVTRLLPRPLPLAVPLRVGEMVGLGQRVYTIERVRFLQRLDEVEWWTPEPVSRDYLRVWLAGAEGGMEALVFVDRSTGERFVHAWLD